MIDGQAAGAATLHLGGDAYAHPSLSSLLRDVDSLSPYPGNPRRGDLEMIVESIRVNGLYRPVVVQQSTGHIIAGNHVVAALTRLGAGRVPVVGLDVDDREAARIVLADNRTADLGGYDIPALVELLDSLEQDAYLGTGYSEADLASLLVDLHATQAAGVNEAGYVITAGDYDTDGHWQNMPGYESGDERPFRRIIVSFADGDAVDEFARRLDARVTEKVRWMWFPPKEPDRVAHLRYVAGDGDGL